MGDDVTSSAWYDERMQKVSAPRPHEPAGTYVAVIRSKHGWHDGRVAGYLIDDFGTVKVDNDGEEYTLECAHRGDYDVCHPTVRPRPPSKRDEKRKQRDERREKRRRGIMEA